MKSPNNNILANFIGVTVTTVLTLVVVPFYLKTLGPDAYGLVGIATMIQGWIMLLNSGLAPVAGRQAAQAHVGAASWEQTARFFGTIDWFLIGLSFAVVGLVFVLRDWLANHWLGNNSLGMQTIATCIVLLVLMTLIRLVTSVKRGIVANLDEQVWLNVNLVVFNLLRFAVSLPIISIWPDITNLFVWWLVVAVLEYVSIQFKIIALVPVRMPFFVFDLVELKRHGKLAGTLALTSSIWVVITNLDKLLLSGMLSLANYGYFSIATLLASGVLSLTQPISQAYQPRLTKAFVQGGVSEVCSELRRCTHWVALLILPVGAVIFAMPESILLLWTRDHTVSAHAATILRGYVLGSTLSAMGSLLYIFQVAIGNVRWHLRGILIFAICLFPALPVVVRLYGAEGAAWLWAGFNLFLFLIWNSFLLKKLAKPLFPTWLIVDAVFPMLVSFGMAMVAAPFFLKIENPVFLFLAIVALIVSISATLWFIAIQHKFKLARYES